VKIQIALKDAEWQELAILVEERKFAVMVYNLVLIHHLVQIAKLMVMNGKYFK
jgi:hypothetical protein